MYEILETNMGRLQQLINRFNNKAKRFGLEPIQLEVQNEEYREFEYQVSEGTHARIVLKVFQVEITGAAPVLVDQEGREFAWFSSGTSLEVGAQITIKGTVKEHRQYEGKKQTVLTRCKVAI